MENQYRTKHETYPMFNMADILFDQQTNIADKILQYDLDFTFAFLINETLCVMSLLQQNHQCLAQSFAIIV